MRRCLSILIASALVPAALAISASPAVSANSPEAVEIPLKGGGHLKASLFRPDGKGPFPAVIGLHNCTGLTNRNGVMGSRYRDWAQRLAKANFAVLLPDSNGSRGTGNQCGVRRSSIRVDHERVADAEAARDWLQQQKWVVPNRISLVGWASGAIAALWAVRVRPQPPEGTDFRSAIAFYPGCRRLSNVAWSARVPTLILIGRADDQASAAACQQMVAGARGRSAKVDIHIYPSALHDFDHPNRPVQLRRGLAFSVDGSGRAHSGTDPAARADALRRVPAFLSR
jgi:dienelactone hydrolase